MTTAYKDLLSVLRQKETANVIPGVQWPIISLMCNSPILTTLRRYLPHIYCKHAPPTQQRGRQTQTTTKEHRLCTGEQMSFHRQHTRSLLHKSRKPREEVKWCIRAKGPLTLHFTSLVFALLINIMMSFAYEPCCTLLHSLKVPLCLPFENRVQTAPLTQCVLCDRAQWAWRHQTYDHVWPSIIKIPKHQPWAVMVRL